MMRNQMIHDGRIRSERGSLGLANQEFIQKTWLPQAVRIYNTCIDKFIASLGIS